MANCTQCGAELKNGIRFCTECGAAAPVTPAAPIEEPPVTPPTPQPQAAPQPTPQPQATPQPAPQPQAAPAYHYPPPQTAYQAPPAYTAPAPDAPPAGSKYELISAGGFIGIMLLMCIPVIGIILTIVWACGGCRKYQKRNLARASLIMMAVALVISLVLGFAVKGVVNKAIKEAGITQSETTGGLFSGLLGGNDKNAAAEETQSGGLLGLIGALGGEGSTGNSDLNELQEMLNQLEGLTGEDMGGDELVDEIDKINQDASKHSNGWPSDLPDFPGGTMNPLEDYRTEFTGTTLEDTKAYIETLKDMGYEYQDFYDFGMSEADMMEYGGWWGYNGKWYLSISYSEGTTIIDHVTELPDMSNLLG